MDAPRCTRCQGPTELVKSERRFYSKEYLFVCPKDPEDCGGPPIRVHRARSAKRRYLILAVLLFVAASVDSAALVGASGSLLGSVLKTLSFVLFIASIYFVYGYYARRNGAEFRASHAAERQPTPLVDANYDDITKRARTSTFDAHHAQIFAAAILTPRQFRRRVVERYEIGNRTLHQRITIEAAIPARMLTAGGDGSYLPVFFPVLVPRKGRIQDSFSMTAGDGADLPCLSYREYLLLATRTILLLASYSEGGNGSDPLTPDAERAALAATKLVAARLYRGRATGDLSGVETWYEDFRIDEKDVSAATAKRSLRALANVLHRSYAVIAIVRPDSSGRVLINVEQDIVPSLKLNWRARAAITIGARPVDLSVGLELASSCEIYHMRVISTPDLYLADQKLVDGDATLAVVKNEVLPHYQLRPRLGQSFAHFYSRFFPLPVGTEKPCLRVKFFERPPGSMLPAAASAFVTFVLVWAIALVTKSNPDPTSDAPAWLLAFPALAAAWLGIEAPSDRLLEGTFAARASLGITVTTCIAAAVSFMAHNVYNERIGFHWWALPGSWEVFWIGDVVWLVLFSVAIANSSTTIYSYLKRAAYYEYLSSRGKDSEVQENA